MNKILFSSLFLSLTFAASAFAASSVCTNALQLPVGSPKACKRAAFCAKLPGDQKAKGYRPESHAFFDAFQAACPEQIWKPELDEKAKNALEDYTAKRKLASGKSYGESVRKYKMGGKGAEQIAREMQALGCKRQDDVLKDFKTHEPVKDAKGSTIPLVVFLCDDGGVVRYKPAGDPLSKFRPQPHGSKCLRYPADAEFKNFDDEMLKVDEDGRALPKSPRDLAQVFRDKDIQAKFTDGWAEDVHSDLAPSK